MILVAAAIKFYMENDKYPTIMTAKRHADIFKKMYDLHIKYDKNTAIQGFLTDNNTFVNRYEAFGIACDAEQLTEDAIKRYSDGNNYPLFSEDVW